MVGYAPVDFEGEYVFVVSEDGPVHCCEACAESNYDLSLYMRIIEDYFCACTNSGPNNTGKCEIYSEKTTSEFYCCSS